MTTSKTVRERLAGKALIGFQTSAKRLPSMVGKVEAPGSAPRAMVGTEVRAPGVMAGAEAPRAMIGENDAAVRGPRAMIGEASAD